MSSSYKYVWPEGPSFSSSYACRFLPRAGKSKFSNVIFGPILNLFDIRRSGVWVFSLGLFAIIYVLIYYVLPINFVNSTDGQYINQTRAIVSTIVIYYLLSTFLVSFLTDRGCKDLEEQAKAYLFNEAPPIPATLAASAFEV
jgi:hypothetical protein